MPATSRTESPQIKKLRQSLAQSVATLEKNHPAIVRWLGQQSTHLLDSVDSAVLDAFQTDSQKDELKSAISLEELATIVQKMIELSQLPPGVLEKQSQLYLEQQLSDLFGFEVTAILDDHQLPFNNGIMAALPHLKRHHTDALEQHDTIREAGLAQKRSSFGWFAQEGSGGATNAGAEKEKYCITLPLYYQSQDQRDFQRYQKWYAHRKVVVINPAESRAVVAVVGTIAPLNLLKHQYGGSPELIRDGLIWSPLAQGRVLLFFVDDPDDTIELGMIDFKSMTQNISSGPGAAV